MISSRNLTDLHPRVAALARRHVEECKKAGIDLLIYCTYRDFEAQDALYAQRPKVTNAKGGDSYHNYRLAYDCVPLRHGKPIWDNTDPVWQIVGKVGKAIGLEWAGDWKSFREYPHFQYTGGLTLADLQSGKRLTEYV